MNHNLQVAVGIADAIALASSRNLPLNIWAEAMELARRHEVPGLSPEDIAVALKEEGEAAGVATR